MTSEQQPPVNNGHNFGVKRVVFVHRFDSTLRHFCCIFKALTVQMTSFNNNNLRTAIFSMYHYFRVGLLIQIFIIQICYILY